MDLTSNGLGLQDLRQAKLCDVSNNFCMECL